MYKSGLERQQQLLLQALDELVRLRNQGAEAARPSAPEAPIGNQAGNGAVMSGSTAVPTTQQQQQQEGQGTALGQGQGQKQVNFKQQQQQQQRQGQGQQERQEQGQQERQRQGRGQAKPHQSVAPREASYASHQSITPRGASYAAAKLEGSLAGTPAAGAAFLRRFASELRPMAASEVEALAGLAWTERIASAVEAAERRSSDGRSRQRRAEGLSPLPRGDAQAAWQASSRVGEFHAPGDIQAGGEAGGRVTSGDGASGSAWPRVSSTDSTAYSSTDRNSSGGSAEAAVHEGGLKPSEFGATAPKATIPGLDGWNVDFLLARAVRERLGRRRNVTWHDLGEYFPLHGLLQVCGSGKKRVAVGGLLSPIAVPLVIGEHGLPLVAGNDCCCRCAAVAKFWGWLLGGRPWVCLAVGQEMGYCWQQAMAAVMIVAAGARQWPAPGGGCWVAGAAWAITCSRATAGAVTTAMEGGR